MTPPWIVPFKGWMPDLPPVVNPGLVTATNVLPGAAGYLPLPSLSSTGHTPLTNIPRGAISGLDANSISFHVVGDETKLYRLSSTGLADISRVSGGAYAATGSAQWHFAQVEASNSVIAVNPSDDPQIYDLAGGNFALLSADAPRARYIGYIGPLLIVGHLVSDPIFGLAPDAYRSPNIDDPTDWPDPTDPGSGATAAQAVLAHCPGSGGRIQAIVGGSEVGAIFQEKQVCRAEYVGGDVILRVDPVGKTRGLIAPRAAVAFERKILYFAEDGWSVFDYTESKLIADQVINETFLRDIDLQYVHRISATLHPDLPVIAIAYPGAGNTAGRPNKILMWNYKVDKWTTAEVEVELLTSLTPFSETLDELTGNLDTDYPISFDERVSGFGYGVFSAYDATKVLGSFNNTSMAGTLETGDQQHVPGRLARVRKVRPLVDGGSPTVQVAVRNERQAAVSYGSAAAMNSEGLCPISGGKGRYHRYRVNLPAGWTGHAVGLEVLGAPSGGR